MTGEMVRIVVSIRPEFRGRFSPAALIRALQNMGDVRIVEGEGFRTVTVETSRNLSELTERLPQVSIRPSEHLSLL